MLMTRARSFLSVVLLGAAATLGGTAHSRALHRHLGSGLRRDLPEPGLEGLGAVRRAGRTCLALGNGSDIPISGACAGFDVLSAKVDFYNIAAPSTILGSFDLNTRPLRQRQSSLTAGQLTGVDTPIFRLFVPTLAIAGGGTYSFSLILLTAASTPRLQARHWSTPTR